MQRRYHIATYGCRVNQADSAALAHRLDRAAWTRTGDEADADVIVLNTCTVTHRSDADVRKAVNRLQRTNPDAKVVVAGCMAHRAPDELVQLRGVHGVLGNDAKHRIAELADRIHATPTEAPEVWRSDFDPNDLPPVDPVADVLDRSRPFVKIQDGCDAKCTYCIIPSVRGPARSAPAERVLSLVRALVDKGHHEVVLTGVHLGTYAGGDGFGLPELVRAALDVPGLGWLRLSCIEPMAFPEGLIDLAASHPKLAPHFHLPLQAGSDRVLKRMVRPYRSTAYVELLQTLRRRVPGACLGADVIVGFPGETDGDFEATLQTVEAASLDYVHVFSYSDREGTPSTRLGPKVDPRTIKARSQTLNAWSRRAWDRFLARQIGRVLDAVALEPADHAPELTRAVADNYAPLLVAGPPADPNRPLRCRGRGRAGRFLEAARVDDDDVRAAPATKTARTARSETRASNRG